MASKQAATGEHVWLFGKVESRLSLRTLARYGMSSSSVRASISMADGLAMRFEPARLRRCAPDELVR
eukprot:2761215-Prymnesium_polylepis.1